jgi:hypothetical protein
MVDHDVDFVDNADASFARGGLADDGKRIEEGSSRLTHPTFRICSALTGVAVAGREA